MKKILKFLFILLVSVNSIYTSEPLESMATREDQEELRNIFLGVKRSLDRLSNKSDLNSSFAILDFYNNIKNPSCKIDYPSSKEILNKLGLLDRTGSVHKDIRSAFKAHMHFTSRK